MDSVYYKSSAFHFFWTLFVALTMIVLLSTGVYRDVKCIHTERLQTIRRMEEGFFVLSGLQLGNLMFMVFFYIKRFSDGMLIDKSISGGVIPERDLKLLVTQREYFNVICTAVLIFADMVTLCGILVVFILYVIKIHCWITYLLALLWFFWILERAIVLPVQIFYQCIEIPKEGSKRHMYRKYTTAPHNESSTLAMLCAGIGKLFCFWLKCTQFVLLKIASLLMCVFVLAGVGVGVYVYLKG